MNEKLKALYEKYKDLVPYVIFGVLTTAVNYVSYWLFAHPLGCGTVFSTAAAWVLSVLFAYVTNRRWVFIFHPKGVYAFFVQLGGFCLGRLLTLGIEEMMLYFCIEVYHLPNMLIKMLAQIIVIALNYVFSKLIVFRGKK